MAEGDEIRPEEYRQLADAIAQAIKDKRGPAGFRPFSRDHRPGIRFFTLTLDVARTDKEVTVAAEGGLVVVDATSATSSASVAFTMQNSGSDNRGPLKKSVGYKISFESIFITNTAQPGESLTIALLDSRDFDAVNLNLGSIANIGNIQSIEGLTAIPTGYIRVPFNGQRTQFDLAGNTILYTVPALKRAYLVEAHLEGATSGAISTMRLSRWNAAAVEVENYLFYAGILLGTNEEGLMSSQPNFGFRLLTAGETIRIAKDSNIDTVFASGLVLEGPA